MSIRRHYSDGCKRPLYRGWLHVVVAFVLLLGMITLRMPLALFMSVLGKFMSYAASALFHLFDAQNYTQNFNLFKLDLAMIPVSIGSTAFMFSSSKYELVATAYATVFISIINAWLVDYQYSTALITNKYRVALCFIYAMCTLAQIACHSGVGMRWLLGFFSYAMAGCISPPFTANYAPQSWHVDAQNGYHEDFHFLLLAADSLFLSFAFF
jgi:hypothetical protein